jgi:hypothetical protein
MTNKREEFNYNYYKVLLLRFVDMYLKLRFYFNFFSFLLIFFLHLSNLKGNFGGVSIREKYVKLIPRKL